jgi:hypothetical protein
MENGRPAAPSELSRAEDVHHHWNSAIGRPAIGRGGLSPVADRLPIGRPGVISEYVGGDSEQAVT